MAQIEPGLALRVAAQQEAAPQGQFLPSSKQAGKGGGALLLSVLMCFYCQDSQSNQKAICRALLLGRFRLKEEWTRAWDDKTQGNGACH